MSPVIDGCPAVVTEVVELGITSTPIFWIEPMATDISGVSILTMRSHEPSDVFPVGSTTVTYVFSDGVGNTATCTFMVFITTSEFFMIFFLQQRRGRKWEDKFCKKDVDLCLRERNYL